MDGFSAFICGAQAVDYAFSIIKSLNELRDALKHGRYFLHEAKASVDHLREIITQLIPSNETELDSGLVSLLKSINVTINSLLVLFKQQNRLQIVFLLVFRRAELNESFALLERNKNTLNLYLNAQNSAAIASLKMSTSKSTSQNSAAIASLKTSTSKSTSQNSAAIASLKTSTSKSTSQKGPRAVNLSADKSALPIPKPNQRPLPSTQQPSTVSGAKPNAKNTNSSPSLPQEGKPKGTARTVLKTRKNRTANQGRQVIYSPNLEGMEATHEENSSVDGAAQVLGMDATMQLSSNFWGSGAPIKSAQNTENEMGKASTNKELVRKDKEVSKP